MHISSGRIALAASLLVSSSCATTTSTSRGATTPTTGAGVASGSDGDVNREVNTRVVNNPDGSVTTTTIETTTVTRNGRTTRNRRVTIRTEPGSQGGGSAPTAHPLPPPDEGRPMPPPQPSVPPSPPPLPPTAEPDTDMVNASLAAHSRVRAHVGLPPLAWDDDLARLATEWAQHICQGGRSFGAFEHRPQRAGGPGENLWMGATTETSIYPVSAAVNDWAGERRYFDAETGRCQGGECRHYTQLVWRGTTQVGCGMATCPDGDFNATVWVCNYAPAGNVIGEKPY
jgi:pathogenesis-related protein 1